MTRYDDLDEPGQPRPRGRRGAVPKRRHSRKAKIFGWIAVIVTVMVTGTSLVAYAAYLNTVHSIDTFSTASLGNDRPPAYNSSENILLVGSDSRGGANKKFGAYVQGQRSDTMMILHIRPDHRGAVVISLPRDSEVPILYCAKDSLGDPGQTADPSQTEMLNASFAFGGPTCVWKTIEQLTGIRIDHYVGLTFTGFEKVVNDIGGVNVCLPFAIKDPKSGIDLTAGEHHVGGAQALAFWRERYVGEGSDLQRIQRQQYLMAGLIQEVKSGQLLGDYTKMYSVLRDTAKALTVDQGLSVTDMVSLAENLRSLSEKSVEFVTVPNYPDPNNEDRVLWQEPQAKNLFYAVAHDTTIPKSSKSSSGSSPSSGPTTSPSNVQVAVQNGSGVTGEAAKAVTALTGAGFKATNDGNGPNFNYTNNIVEYASSSDLSEADTVKNALGGTAQVQLDPSLSPGTVTLVIGSSYSGLAGSSSGKSSGSSSSSSSSSSSVENLNQTYGGINGGADICKDSNAFTGPDNPSDGT